MMRAKVKGMIKINQRRGEIERESECRESAHKRFIKSEIKRKGAKEKFREKEIKRAR